MHHHHHARHSWGKFSKMIFISRIVIILLFYKLYWSILSRKNYFLMYFKSWWEIEIFSISEEKKWVCCFSTARLTLDYKLFIQNCWQFYNKIKTLKSFIHSYWKLFWKKILGKSKLIKKNRKMKIWSLKSLQLARNPHIWQTWLYWENLKRGREEICLFYFFNINIVLKIWSSFIIREVRLVRLTSKKSQTPLKLSYRTSRHVIKSCKWYEFYLCLLLKKFKKLNWEII